MMQDRTYEDLIRPLLFCLDAESAHNLVHRLLLAGGPLLDGMNWRYGGNDLACQIAGVAIPNPVGLAAGFDKNGCLTGVIAKLGFGFAEVGSVTARASKGNPKPRLFRLVDDEAVINRMGLNGEGADGVAARLSTMKATVPIGLNIAKTNDPAITGDAVVADYLYTFKAIRHLPLAFVTVNASCPNTKEGVIKGADEVDSILSEMQALNDRRLPILLKLSPESSDDFLDKVADIGKKARLAGYVCGNTSTGRAGLTTPEARINECGNGGLSGRPLKPLAMHLVRRMFDRKTADQAITACGGIQSGQDAYEFLLAGASTVQVYTGLIYKGPALVRQINEELSRLLARDGRGLTHLIADVGAQAHS